MEKIFILLTLNSFVYASSNGDLNDYEIVHVKNESIFAIKSDALTKCERKCGDSFHTLCYKSKQPNGASPHCYPDFRVYPTKFRKFNYKNELEAAHNGIRSRIARKMRVANMQVVVWDRELTEMAENYLARCDPFVDDPCVQGPRFSERKFPWQMIAMNRYTTSRLKFYPIDILERAIQTWYGEKNDMNAPNIEEKKIGGSSEQVGILESDNNFTHMAYPELQKIGCSLALNNERYTLACFYYPYIQNTYQFRFGTCCDLCNYNYALKSLMYSALCSSNRSPYLLGSSLTVASMAISTILLCIFYVKLFLF